MRTKSSFAQRAFFTALLLLACSLAAWGQAMVGLGAVSGTVRDASGSPVPGARVVVSNPELGLTRELTTTDAGLFAAPALTPALGYQVSVSKQGFTPYEAKDLPVTVGNTTSLNISLTVGAITQTVEVTGAAPVVDAVKTETSQVVNNLLVNDLPINGRRVDAFVLITPAVTKDADYGLVTFRGIAGGNAFLIDGNDTTNQYYNENAGRTRLGSQISQDAVQEFQVLSSTYSAEFGKSSGGVINTITKSGTNDVHGTAFEFFRNRSLDARDRFSAVNPQDIRHIFGGTAGGPIKKDKLFFFGSTEIQRRNAPITDTIINSSVSQATQTWIGCGAPATPAQCSAINSLLPRMFQTVNRTPDQELAFLKVDYRPNEKNTFSASLNYLHWQSVNGIQTSSSLTNGGAIGNNGDDKVFDRIGKLQWTFVPTGSMVNEFHFGWFKDRQADDFDPADQASYPIGNVGLSVAGVSTLGGYNILPRVLPSENRYQFIDNLSKIHGAHDLKFGFDVARTEDFANYLSNRFGTFTYPNVTAFAEDFTNPTPGPSHYSSFTQSFGNPIADTTITDLGFYAQDTWKVSSKLTANYGVRYEYSILPQPTTVNPYYPQTGRIPSAGRNFAPRIGLAYSLNDRTVIRAGYGLYYARYVSGMINNVLFQANDVYTQSLTIQSPTSAGAPIFPYALTSPAGALASNRSITFAAPNMRNPYTQQANLAIERALGKTTSMTVSYIQNRGKRLYTVRDLNIGPLSSQAYDFTILNSSYQPTGQVWSSPIYLLSNRIDTRYGHIDQIENGGKQWYDGLAVQVNKRFSETFQGNLSYTWSHELDENQEAGTNAIYFSSLMSLYNGAYGLDKASGQLDQRQRFVATFVARPKFTHSNNAFARYVVNGWEWTGFLTLASGRPYYESVSWSSTTNLPQAFTTTLNGFGGDNRVPWLPNNPLMLDPITRFDTRLAKKFAINERMAITLLFEAMNLTNTVSNTGVVTAGFTAANKGTAAAPNFVVAPCASATATVCAPETPGLGNASAGFPDGTNARRADVGLRLVF